MCQNSGIVCLQVSIWFAPICNYCHLVRLLLSFTIVISVSFMIHLLIYSRCAENRAIEKATNPGVAKKKIYIYIYI